MKTITALLTAGKKTLRHASGLERLFFWLYLFLAVSVFLYSFTQVDLSLTLSRASILTDIQRFFQHIGYFNHPLATTLFIVLMLLLTALYISLLQLIKQGRISQAMVFLIIGVVGVILMGSYNAFSYDLFNYIFDAKIVTNYQENPYEHKALDYQGDPMLSFMRWTHRVYPYGPVWLALTVPLSFIGLQFFLPTFFLFKLFIASAYFGSVYFLYKILKEVVPKYAVVGTAFFALNPLVLIESLVSAHNDIVMLFFGFWGIYALLQKKGWQAYLLLVITYGIKFATQDVSLWLHLLLLILLGVGIWFYLKIARDREGSAKILLYSAAFLMMLATVIFASRRTTFQPWYLVSLLPLFAVFADKRAVIAAGVMLTLGALGNYVPFLFTGNWDPPIPRMLLYLNIGTVTISLMTFFILSLSRKKLHA